MSGLRFVPASATGGGTVADADATTKGIVQLAGDLGGTAASPTVPGLAGKAATVHTHAQTDVTGLVSALAAKADDAATTTALLAKAPVASPTFTGDPKAPTPAQGDNDTSIATTAYVQTEAGLLIPKSLVDAKGDLLVGSADNTVIRKAVGTDGQVLTADAASTGGIKWASSSPPAFSGARAYLTGANGISNASFGAQPFNGESWDTDGFHDNATNNSRMTVPAGKAGYVELTAEIQFAANATGVRQVRIMKNGATEIARSSTNAGSAAATSVQVVSRDLAIVGDYYTVEPYQDSGGGLNANANATWFEIRALGA